MFEVRTTRSVTLPAMNARMPVCPCVPMTIRSIASSTANRLISSTGLPRRMYGVALTPSCSSRAHDVLEVRLRARDGVVARC